MSTLDKVTSQWAKSRIFDNMALYFDCRINKNVLLQTVFLAILPTGKKLQSLKKLQNLKKRLKFCYSAHLSDLTDCFKNISNLNYIFLSIQA